MNLEYRKPGSWSRSFWKGGSFQTCPRLSRQFLCYFTDHANFEVNRITLALLAIRRSLFGHEYFWLQSCIQEAAICKGEHSEEHA